jgi:hypothetical protein
MKMWFPGSGFMLIETHGAGFSAVPEQPGRSLVQGLED